MRDVQILQQTLENQCPEIHKKRLKSLILATQTVLDGSDLTLTKIGRALDTDTTVKHAIKRIDRLLGNSNLHREKESIYKWYASFITRANPFPVVLVDWSDVREQLRYMTLRASVSVKGRAVTLYEQAFEYKNYNSPKSHQHFLDKLQSLLPKGCTPIIISDASFRNTWFRQVANKGWFWLGRVRGEVSIKCGEGSWQWSKTFYPQATDKPLFLGESQLAKRSPLQCFAYLYKSHPKGRKAHRHSRTCQKHSAGKVFHKGAKEPWLLVTNLPNNVLNGIKITRLYAKRMQIEESFRDLKSPAYGLALRHNRTRCTKRIDILLLMALMAEIIMWWNGLVAMRAKWHYDFQANTIKHRRVLSIPRLGKEVRCHRRYRIQESQYHWAIVEYQRLTHTCGLGDL